MRESLYGPEGTGDSVVIEQRILAEMACNDGNTPKPNMF
jgi:hypothetical protein